MTIRTIPIPEQGRVTIWDDSSPLGLRITSKGAKTFIVMLGPGRRHTIGRYGMITLSQARTAAKQLKAEHTLGRLIPSSRAVSDAASEYLKGITIRTNTRRYYQRNLGRLPDVRLSDLTAGHLHTILDPLSPPARGQALKTYVAFFNWCIRRHYLDQSPCHRFRGEKTTSRSRVLGDEELGRIWAACEQLVGRPTVSRAAYGLGNDAVGRGDKSPLQLRATFARIIQLLILTGLRRTEASLIEKSWIQKSSKQTSISSSNAPENEKKNYSHLSDSSNPDLWTLTIPSSVTKNHREHTIPITAFTGQFLPLSTDNRPFRSWSETKKTLDKASGVTNWTIHDLRRSFASNHARIGTSIHIIERLLNHVTGSMSAIHLVYNRHRYFDEMVAAVQKYDEWFRLHILQN
jgi:integrase